MAIAWTNYEDGTKLGIIRNKINSFSAAVVAAVNKNTTDIVDIYAKLATAPSMVNIASGVRAPQTLVAGVPERLEWMTVATVDAGGSDISYVMPNNQFKTLTAAKYKLTGVISFTAAINDEVDVELYIDNVATGFISSAIGRGATGVFTLTYATIVEFAINDEIDLYITSSGTEITVQSANITLEKTPY